MNEERAVRMDLESDYFARREAQERLAAEQSADMTARRAHAELADLYAEQRRSSPEGLPA
jgi:hypothetical protein